MSPGPRGPARCPRPCFPITQCRCCSPLGGQAAWEGWVKWRGQALRNDGSRDELPFIRVQIATGGNYLQSGGRGAGSAPAAIHERSLFVLEVCRNEAGRKVPIDVSARGQGARVSRCLRGVKFSDLTIYRCESRVGTGRYKSALSTAARSSERGRGADDQVSGARLRTDMPPGMAKASEMVLLSLPQADSP